MRHDDPARTRRRAASRRSSRFPPCARVSASADFPQHAADHGATSIGRWPRSCPATGAGSRSRATARPAAQQATDALPAVQVGRDPERAGGSARQRRRTLCAGARRRAAGAAAAARPRLPGRATACGSAMRDGPVAAVRRADRLARQVGRGHARAGGRGRRRREELDVRLPERPAAPFGDEPGAGGGDRRRATRPGAASRARPARPARRAAAAGSGRHRHVHARGRTASTLSRGLQPSSAESRVATERSARDHAGNSCRTLHGWGISPIVPNPDAYRSAA